MVLFLLKSSKYSTSVILFLGVMLIVITPRSSTCKSDKDDYFSDDTNQDDDDDYFKPIKMSSEYFSTDEPEYDAFKYEHSITENTDWNNTATHKD